MVTVLHFLELRSFFHQEEIGKPFPVTIEKLAGIWHCTPRHAKLIVRKLVELDWIEWKAGRGRGNVSVMTLHADSDDILLAEVKLQINKGDVQEAMELMNRYGKVAAKDQIMDWLSEGMGFSSQLASQSVSPQDILRFPVYRRIVTLDPGLVYYHFDAHLVGQIFNTLVQYDLNSRSILPSIAHSWESSPDAREWIFYLKKNVLFHHGRELTAHDVVFSLNRLRLYPDTYEASWMFRDIDQLITIDDRTVRILLKEPNYLLLRMLATIPASIVPEEIVRQDEKGFGEKPIGTGPFQLVRLTEGICILEAFPAHFLGRPQLDRVEILIFPELDTGRLKEPNWASVMVSHGVQSKALALKEAVIQDGQDWCDTEAFFSCCNLLVFNQWKSGSHNHLKFRQALDQLIDRDQMIADLGGDRIYPAKGFRTYHPVLREVRARENEQPCHAQIMSLLQESGYQGETLRLVTTAYHEEDALWIQQRCGEYDINLAVDVREPWEFSNRDCLPEHDCQLYGNVFSSDQISELEMYLQRNYFLPAFDESLTLAINKEIGLTFQEPDRLAREHHLARIEAMIKENYAVLYLVQKKTLASFHKSLRGVSINSLGWLDFHKIWFQPDALQQQL
ncbi:SgrR family transcriptional regulator [Brevibacillus brevis]|uniref:SgrR family transcriptional regulator n=1 Tax=Brevibacillus brevis TaxID=1393 RepID=UPI0025A5853B|nr:SgrR family transcriptional regulator [Brevibacillus brevis]WJQ80297.1 ABC transporter substrate-binding protein [Brevibacillus brevis]